MLADDDKGAKKDMEMEDYESEDEDGNASEMDSDHNE
jgi:hypothetical protein